MHNKTQSRMAYISKRINTPPSLQIPIKNIPDLSMTPLRRKHFGVSPRMIQIGNLAGNIDFFQQIASHQSEKVQHKHSQCNCVDCHEKKQTSRKLSMRSGHNVRSVSTKRQNFMVEGELQNSPRKEDQEFKVFNRLMKRTITDRQLLKQVKKLKEKGQIPVCRRARTCDSGLLTIKSYNQSKEAEGSREKNPEKFDLYLHVKSKMAKRYNKRFHNYIGGDLDRSNKLQFFKRENSCPRGVA